MRTFIVHKMKGPAVRYQGYSYSEDSAAGRIYFHKKEDRSDKDSFAIASGVFGIDEELPQLSPAEQEERMLTSPAFEDALKGMLAKIEKRKNERKKPNQQPEPMRAEGPHGSS